MELGKLTAVFDADTRKFDAGFRSVENRIGGVTTGLGSVTTNTRQLTSTLDPAGTQLTGFSTKMGQMAGVSVIAATAIGGVITGIFNLAKETASYGARLQDLNDKTGIGVENLSALKLAFDQSGGSIDAGATSLSRYLRSVADANTGNDKLRQKFLEVGFTVDDLNASYGDSDKAVEILVKRIGGMSNSQDRLNALQKLGVRNGMELNGAIVAMNGNLEKFRKEADRLGLVITPEQAKAADDFDDSLALLEKQIKGMGFSIARQYLPEISGAIKDVNGALANNKGAWADWGSFIKTEIRGIRVAAAALSGFMEAWKVSSGNLFFSGATAVAEGILKSRQLRAQEKIGDTSNIYESASIFRKKVDLGVDSGESAGGRGGGGRGAKVPTDELAAYKQIVDNVTRSLQYYGQTTERSRVEQDFLRAGIEKLNPAMRSQAEAYKRIALTVADTIDLKRKLTEQAEDEKAAQEALERVTADVDAAIFKQGQEIADLVSNYPTWLRQTYDFIVAKRNEGFIWDENTRQIYLNNEARREQLRVMAQGATRERQVWPGMRSTGQETRPRIATVEEQVIRERIAIVREQMMGLGQELTGIFSRSVGDGFEQGAKRGLATLALGLLDIVQNIFLKKLAEGLGNLLSDFALGSGKGGGGGIVSGILKTVVGAIGGSVGGGGATTWGNFKLPPIGRATGGPVVAGLPYKVHRDEIILPAQNGMVFNKSQQGGAVNNYYINLPPSPKGSYNAPASQRELANKLVSALQGAQS